MVRNFKINKNYGNDNVIMNQRTVITESTMNNEEFQCIDVPDTLDIASFSNVAPEQIVSFKAKIVNLSGEKKFDTQKGCFVKQEAFAVDPTGTIRIVLWGDYVNQLKQDVTYNLTGLRLKQADGEKYVNTPKGNYFHFKETADFPNELPNAEDVPVLRNIQITANVVGVTSLTKFHCCSACNRKLSLENASSKIGQCTHCKMTQKVANASTNWFVKLFIEESTKLSNKVTLTATQFQPRKFKKRAHVDFHLATEETITEASA